MWAWESDDDFYIEETRASTELTPEEEAELREAIEVIRILSEVEE